MSTGATNQLISVSPPELKFQFELDKQSYCDLKVTNSTDQCVAFKVKTTSPKKYFVRPNTGIIQPWDSAFIRVTLQAQKEYPPDMQCKDKFLLQSTIVNNDIDELPPGISPEDEYFHCESCNGELVAESDKLASQGTADGDDNDRRRRREKLEDMLHRVEAQLKPLMDQLARVKDLPAPEFGSLQAWEVRANAVARGANGDNANDSKSGQGLGFGGTPMPFVGETKVEVAFSGLEEKGDIKSEVSATPMKVLPPWMIKEGMNLTKEQRGEVKQESNMEGTSAAAGSSDDKKSIENEDVKNIQDEYVKAYYEAIFKRQREQEEAAKMLPESSTTDGVYNTSTARQVGMKSKREEEDEGEDIEWEEAPAPPAGNNTTGNLTVDLNVQANASDEENDEEDDIDWEEG